MGIRPLELVQEEDGWKRGGWRIGRVLEELGGRGRLFEERSMKPSELSGAAWSDHPFRSKAEGVGSLPGNRLDIIEKPRELSVNPIWAVRSQPWKESG